MRKFKDKRSREIYETRFASNVPEHVSIAAHKIMRIMVAAGSHQIDIVNKALGYRVTRTVQVTPNKAVAIPIKLPTGSMAVNAVPWANVFLDGVDMGETPIGNLSATIGSHELVFRHPDLGEQRRTVTVTLAAPLRVSADLRKK